MHLSSATPPVVEIDGDEFEAYGEFQMTSASTANDYELFSFPSVVPNTAQSGWLELFLDQDDDIIANASGTQSVKVSFNVMYSGSVVDTRFDLLNNNGYASSVSGSLDHLISRITTSWQHGQLTLCMSIPTNTKANVRAHAVSHKVKPIFRNGTAKVAEDPYGHIDIPNPT